MDWKSSTRKLSELIPAKYNPRKISKKQMEDLNKSLDRFDLCDPIIINTDNTVIGGHQRIKALKARGVETVDVRVPERKLTLDEEKELNLRLNKNNADWNDDLLKDFDRDMLVDVGFDVSDIFTEKDDGQESSDEDEIRTPFGDDRDFAPLVDLLNNYSEIIVQFSGGKDSIAMLLKIISLDGLLAPIRCTMCITTMDPPDIEEYANYVCGKLNVPLEILIPDGDRKKMQNSFESKLVKYGYPGRMNNWCNTMFKVNAFKVVRKEVIKNNKIVCIGTRADESSRRAKMRPRGIWNKMPFVFPIFDLSDDDVRNIIYDHKIKLHYFYKTETRLSCTCCYQQTSKAWARMRRHYPNEWQKALNYYSMSMRNSAFMTGESGYQFDLFKNMITLPKCDEVDVGFEINEENLWYPSNNS